MNPSPLHILDLINALTQDGSAVSALEEVHRLRAMVLEHAIREEGCCCGGCGPLVTCHVCYAWQTAEGRGAYSRDDLVHAKDCPIAAWEKEVKE